MGGKKIITFQFANIPYSYINLFYAHFVFRTLLGLQRTLNLICGDEASEFTSVSKKTSQNVTR